MSGLRTSSVDLDPRRRRLLFRCWHRGIREMDLVLGRFAEAHLDRLADGEIDDLERLIEVPDHDLFSWLTGETRTPANYDTPVFRKVEAFHRHAGPLYA